MAMILNLRTTEKVLLVILVMFSVTLLMYSIFSHFIQISNDEIKLDIDYGECRICVVSWQFMPGSC